MDLAFEKNKIKSVVSKLKDGDIVTFSSCEDLPMTEGVISVVNNKTYVCQDYFDGEILNEEYRKGKKYSWIIGIDSSVNYNEIYDIELHIKDKQFLLPLY